MDQYKLDELVGRPFDTAMALARMILSGLFDRYPRLKIAVAHMGGGLLPVMGRLDFGWRLGCDGMPERAVIRCKRRPSDYLGMLYVDTMGFWAPHVREAVDVFGVDRVMLGPITAQCRSIPRNISISLADLRFHRPTKKKFFGAMPRVFSSYPLRPDLLGHPRGGLSPSPDWMP